MKLKNFAIYNSRSKPLRNLKRINCLLPSKFTIKKNFKLIKNQNRKSNNLKIAKNCFSVKINFKDLNLFQKNNELVNKQKTIKKLSKKNINLNENIDIKYFSKPLYNNLFHKRNKCTRDKIFKLLQKINILNRLKVNINKFNINLLKPEKPFQMDNSEEFFDKVKSNNITAVEILLIKDPLLVFQYNYIKCNAIHISCMKNY